MMGQILHLGTVESNNSFRENWYMGYENPHTDLREWNASDDNFVNPYTISFGKCLFRGCTVTHFAISNECQERFWAASLDGGDVVLKQGDELVFSPGKMFITAPIRDLILKQGMR